jgi:hypothetical protein
MSSPYWNDRVALLEKVFSGKDGRDYLCSLRGPKAEGALELMQMVVVAHSSRTDTH